MPKLYFANLDFEITRKCNMQCPHCLRGNAQNLDIDFKYIDKILENVAFIGSLQITGGEPALNVAAIKKILECCKANHIAVFGVDLSTNGKFISDEFINTMTEFYQYCCQFTKNTNFHIVQLTQDEFHEPISIDNINKLKALPYVNIRYNDFKKDKVLNIGKAKTLAIDYKKPCGPYDRNKIQCVKYNGNYYVYNFEFLNTCTGNVLLACDYAYDEEDKYIITTYDNIINYLEQNCQVVNSIDINKLWPPNL